MLNLVVWFDQCSYLASKGAIKATVGLGQFVREWRALGQFKALEVHARSIVDYPVEYAAGYHVVLDDERVVTVRWDQVKGYS